jgi:HSP20 family protein
MKAVTMYRPNTIQNALSDFDRYFESFFGDSFLAPAAGIFNHMPAVDIRETDKAYVLEMELPGYDEKNITVNIDGSNLSIASRQEETKETKKDKTEDDGGTYVLRERKLNSFSRSFKLPENADPEAVHASFRNGILCLEIQKRAESQKRAIQINAA